MKKKTYFKKWVDYSIVIIQMFIAVGICAEQDNFKLFVISKVLLLGALLVTIKLQKKYGKIMTWEN